MRVARGAPGDGPLARIAFRSSASVALSDSRADWRELKALRALQDAFGLTDARVQSLFEQAEEDLPHRVVR